MAAKLNLSTLDNWSPSCFMFFWTAIYELWQSYSSNWAGEQRGYFSLHFIQLIGESYMYPCKQLNRQVWVRIHNILIF